MAGDTFAQFKAGYAAFFNDVLAPAVGSRLKSESTGELRWHGLDVGLRLRQGQGVMEFVPAIRKRYAGGTKYEKSVGVTLNIPSPTAEDWMSFDVPTVPTGQQSGYREAGPPGFRYETDVFTLTIPTEPIGTRLTAKGHPADAKHLAAAAISFDAALTMAAAAELELELSDFGRTWRLLDDRVQLYYYDVSPGGNGIARAIYNDWVGDRRVAERAAKTILSSTCCREYCDRCILLPRMPEFFVRRGLLNKQFAASFVEE